MWVKYLKLILIIYICNISIVVSQVNVSPLSGCEPLVNVSFTTSNSAYTDISWDFGDGASSLNSPAYHTYPNAGIYTVVFNAKLSGVSVQETFIIHVFENPVAGFDLASPNIGCTPYAAIFNNTSTAASSSTIVDWQWTFGDGITQSTSTGNISHVYSNSGIYDVSLVVTDNNGCSDFILIDTLLTLSSAPEASISSDFYTITNCDTPMTVTFNSSAVSTSIISNSIFYSWDFGNGVSSSAPNAQVDFLPGYYTISLTVSDEYGCSSNSYYTINVIDPFVDFELLNSPNFTICDTAIFHSLSNIPNAYWDYGDGTSGTSTTHYYPNPGTYYVTLTCTQGQCVVDTTIPVTVEDIVANYSINNNYGCSSPLVVEFTDLSTNAVSWEYFFDDGTSSTQQNPTHSFYNSLTGTYDMPILQVFNSALVAHSPHGCTDTLELNDPIILDVPIAWFMPNVINGCAPLTVTFSDSSYAPGVIVSWDWDFGDGTSTTTNTGIVNHTFNDPGIYDVYLTITNDMGCSDISWPVTIEVFYCPPPPPGDPDALDVCACFPECSGAPPDYYPLYDSLYEFLSGCDSNSPAFYTYATDTGIISIEYHNYYDGTLSSYIIVSPLFNVLAPLGHISYDYSCSEPHSFLFHSNAIGADSIVWDFGDSLSINTGNVLDPIHNYVDTGDYVVVLEMYNFSSGCILTDSIEVYVRDIYADFVVPSQVCANTGVIFNAETSEDVYTPCFSGYEWDFGDLSPIINNDSPLVSHAYSQGGYYVIELTVKDINGCIQKHYDSLHVFEIHAALDFSPASFCAPDSVFFTDLSWSDTTIISWDFFPGFGDSLTSIPPALLYDSNNDTILTLSLTVEDALGCVGQWLNIIELNKLFPEPSFLASSNDICPGEESIITIAGLFSSVTWYIDNNTFSGNFFSHQFSDVGLYDLSVVVSDYYGCQDSITIPAYIEVHDLPDVYISADPSEDTLCLPVQITFTDASVVDSFGSRVWNFYNSASISPDASVTWPYEIPGTYQVSLSVESAYGCENSTTNIFNVEGALAGFEISPPIICQGTDVTLTLVDTFNLTSWVWDFGDGQIDSSSLYGTVTHTYLSGFYPSNGQSFVSLIYSSGNCQNTASDYINFYPEVLADFISTDHPDFIICHGDSISVLNTSWNAQSISWDFGDGLNYSAENISHYYPNPGNFPISLHASDNAYNCYDDTTVILEVRSDAVVIAPDVSICSGYSYTMNVTAEGGISSYFWTPEEFFSNPYDAHPEVTIQETQTFQVDIIDGYGCSGTGYQTIYAITDPPSINWDTTIIIGEYVHLDAWYGDYISYSWNPDSSLDNINIADPWALTLNDNSYTVNLVDTVTACFDVTNYYTIYVKPETSFDLPSVFTPNGDMVNDIFYLQGWGIKEIVEFKIYNRWGELVYKGMDIDSGWDGTYKGKDQPNDTYIYVAKVKTWLNQVLEKRGYINLIR